MPDLRSKMIRLAASMPKGSAERKALLDVLADAGPIMDTVNVGDIFSSSWGYNQTNIDFYQVTRKMKAMVVLRKIAKKVVGGVGTPSEKVMPIPNKFTGSPIRKKVKSGWRGKAWIDLTSYSGASPWDGKPESQTGGAYGH